MSQQRMAQAVIAPSNVGAPPIERQFYGTLTVQFFLLPRKLIPVNARLWS